MNPGEQNTRPLIPDETLEVQRIAGEITLVLEKGPPEQQESLLRVLQKLAGKEQAETIKDWVKEGMPHEP